MLLSFASSIISDRQVNRFVNSNTNAGLPGQLTGKQLQKENVFSAATLVAYLAKPDFDGTITYSADDDGDQVGGLGSVEVFASGLRNPYGIVLHSNGYVRHSVRA